MGLTSEQLRGAEFLASRDAAWLGDIPGYGKTAQCIEAMRRLGIRRALIVCPSIARWNWEKELARWWTCRPPVYRITTGSDADDIPVRYEGPMIVIVSVDMPGQDKRLRQRLKANTFDVCVFDECFPKGSQVATPSGDRAIETLRPGDKVLNATGTGTVLALGRSVAVALVKIFMENGCSITCTPEHPILTLRGWVAAGDLQANDRVLSHEEAVRVVQTGFFDNGEEASFLRQALLRERTKAQPDVGGDKTAYSRLESTKSSAESQSGRRVLGTHESAKPHGIGRHQKSGVKEAEDNRASPARSRRKRSAPYSGGSSVSEYVSELSAAIHSADASCQRGKIALSLQDRRRVPGKATGCRDRWRISRIAGKKAAGSEKRPGTRVTGVDSVSVQQPNGSEKPGACEVYNLEVSEHPSYVVNGAIVHNCHYLKQPDSRRTRCFYGQRCDRGRHSLAALCDRHWLLSASPMPNSAAELWTHLRAFWPHLIPDKFGDPLDYESFIEKYLLTRPTKYDRTIVGYRDKAGLARILDSIMLRRTVVEGLSPIAWRDPQVIPGATDEIRTLEQHEELCNIRTVVEAAAARAEGGEELDDDFIHLATLMRLTALAKAKPTAELLLSDHVPGEKTIVYAVHREAMDILQSYLAPYGCVRIDGNTPDRQRNQAMEQFNESHDTPFFLGQLQSCKTAVNLQAADHIRFFESSFCPEDNYQAAMRGQRRTRIGQLTAGGIALAGSVDETVQRVNMRKSALTTDLMESTHVQ